MPVHIAAPTVIPGVGEKVIRELVGNINTGTAELSVARMTSPPGWEEPAQTPEFDEVTVVLEGSVVVEHDGGSITVRPGEAVLARAGERVRYSTPEGAEYVAICVPASVRTPPPGRLVTKELTCAGTSERSTTAAGRTREEIQAALSTSARWRDAEAVAGERGRLRRAVASRPHHRAPLATWSPRPRDRRLKPSAAALAATCASDGSPAV